MGVWILTLCDHEGKLKTAVECETWAGILPALESLLGSGKGTWQPFKSYRKKKKEDKPL